MKKTRKYLMYKFEKNLIKNTWFEYFFFKKNTLLNYESVEGLNFGRVYIRVILLRVV